MTEQQAEQRSMYGTSDIPKYLRVDTLLPSLYDRSPESEFVNVETYVNALEDALQVAVEALKKIAVPTTTHFINGIMCRKCGIETYFEKDGELQHEQDCSQQLASAALQSIKEQAGKGEGDE